MATPILYTTDLSPPCRAVYMTEKALNIELEHKIVGFLKNEHLEEDYIKLNPKHTLPTLVDGKLILTDSHAITSYLVTKYGKESRLYPNDAKSKALIDQMLHFDSSVAFPSLLNTCQTIRLKLASEVTPEMIAKLEDTYSFLDKFLEGKEWVATEEMTIADFHLAATIAAANLFVPIKNYLNICAWFKRMEKLSVYVETEFSLGDFKDLFKHILDK